MLCVKNASMKISNRSFVPVFFGLLISQTGFSASGDLFTGHYVKTAGAAVGEAQNLVLCPETLNVTYQAQPLGLTVVSENPAFDSTFAIPNVNDDLFQCEVSPGHQPCYRSIRDGEALLIERRGRAPRYNLLSRWSMRRVGSELLVRFWRATAPELLNTCRYSASMNE